MPISFSDIEKKVQELALQIDAPQNLLPTYGYSLDGALPHIEIDEADNLYYVVVERGSEISREKFTDLHDLLYEIFNHVSFSMAAKYELWHRIDGEDFRRRLFAKQEELLGILDKDWKKRKQLDHHKVLERYPFT